MEHRRTYYIVSCKLKKVKTTSGTVLTAEDAIGFLGESDGYPQVYSDRASAKHFSFVPSHETMRMWDGAPWYCQIKEFQVTHVEEIVTDVKLKETPL